MKNLEILKTEILEKAKQKYPKMRNFRLTDKAFERFLKNNDNNIDDVVDELYYHIGNRGETPSYIKLLNESKDA